MKRFHYFAVLMLLMIAGLEITAIVEGDVAVMQLSGLHKITYSPYPMDFSPSDRMVTRLDTPIARTIPQSSPLAYTYAQVQERIRIVGESNQPILGAEFIGIDGIGNSLWGITDENGYVNITGAPGNWKFSISAPALGYFSNALIYPFTYSTSIVLMLQAIGPLEKLDLSGHKDKKEFTNIRIIMPAFCSNATEQESNPATVQSTYTGDEG